MIGFTELDGSPVVEVTIEGINVSRQFRILWSNRKAFLQQILGKKDHDYSEALCYRARLKRFEGKVSGSGNYCSYDYAIVEADYATNTFVSVVEHFDPGAEFLTLDSSQYKWSNANGAELGAQEAPGKLDPTMDYTISWRNLTVVPDDVFSSAGFVNKTAINPSSDINPILIDFDFDAETLLLHPPKIARTWDFVEDLATYEVTLHFTYRPNKAGGICKGWNWVWRSSSGSYERIWSIEDAKLIDIYPSMEFKGRLWT